MTGASLSLAPPLWQQLQATAGALAAVASAAVLVLVALLFSKNVYSASLGSYFTFYLIEKFGVEVQTAQLYLFAFLVGIVMGTIAGGIVGDKVGRIPVMWFSIVGALPFALMLPYASLFWTGVLAVLVAAIMASAFSAILVYAQELLPGRVLAQLVVGGALFRVGEDRVGLVDLLHALLGVRLLGDVRMVFARKLAIGLADLLLRSRFRHP